jgi:hypothetical protein
MTKLEHGMHSAENDSGNAQMSITHLHCGNKMKRTQHQMTNGSNRVVSIIPHVPC